MRHILEDLFVLLMQNGNQEIPAGNNMKLMCTKASNKKIFMASEMNLHGMQGESSFNDANAAGNMNTHVNTKIDNLKIHLTNWNKPWTRW